MKKVFLIATALLFFANLLLAQSKSIYVLDIDSNEITSGQKFSSDLKCQAIQSKMFYDNPAMYEMLIGKVLNKKFQTIESGNEAGSILYFEFDGPADDAMSFVKGLMWGGDKPTKEHPELLIAKGNVLIILSFPYESKMSKGLMKYFK